MANQQGVRIEGGKPPNRYTAASIEAISNAYARMAEAFAGAIARVGTAPHSITIADATFDMSAKVEGEDEVA